MNPFYRNIKPHVERELSNSRAAGAQGGTAEAYAFLERAHVLGQAATVLHTRVHWAMLIWGIRQRDPKEVLGQLFRLFGAATMTAIGLVPHGNTGGTDVSPFKSMPVDPELAKIIASAK